MPICAVDQFVAFRGQEKYRCDGVSLYFGWSLARPGKHGRPPMFIGRKGTHSKVTVIVALIGRFVLKGKGNSFENEGFDCDAIRNEMSFANTTPFITTWLYRYFFLFTWCYQKRDWVQCHRPACDMQYTFRAIVDTSLVDCCRFVFCLFLLYSLQHNCI